MTMRCASRSSARSKPSCSVVNTFHGPTNRHGGVCSRFWRAGTTYAACIAVSATARRSNSKTCIRRIKCHRRAGCPPPGSVMVVTGDPPPARGQPATQPYREVPQRIRLNCKSIRRTGSTSNTSSANARTSTCPSERYNPATGPINVLCLTAGVCITRFETTGGLQFKGDAGKRARHFFERQLALTPALDQSLHRG